MLLFFLKLSRVGEGDMLGSPLADVALLYVTHVRIPVKPKASSRGN